MVHLAIIEESVGGAVLALISIDMAVAAGRVFSDKHS